MKEKSESSFLFFRSLLRWWKGVRDWFAESLDVDEERKANIYIDLAKSTTLKDILYWLQIFFSAGIATLGLVQNSSAVIIGAMLISPLMGPILASGLALATGDLILAVRSLASLLLSSLGAILFAVILVSLLPFKEGTAEITSRISPNTLDLVIALFSGAVGSVAICREVKGVVTSIPGVAIAVALMPPLCVVGYGVGLTLSFSGGLKFAIGGGLLYLTNLVAIIFTAMVVFIMLRIDTPKVRLQVREWRQTDPESLWWQTAISKIPSLEHAREIRSMSLRLLMILLPLLLIIIPLSQSYNQLKTEIQQQQAENKVQQKAKELWNDLYAKTEDGKMRSELDELKVNILDDKLEVYMRVFDNTPYSQEEKDSYLNELAKALGRRNDSLSLNIIEIPTSARNNVNPQVEKTPLPPSISDLQGQYLQSVKSAMAGLNFPANASLLDYRIINSPDNYASVQIYYLSDRDIDIDARELLAGEVKRRLSLPNSSVNFERIPIEIKKITFENNGEKISNEDIPSLDEAGRNLQINSRLKLEVSLNQNNSEVLLKEKENTLKNYLAQTWSIAGERIDFVKSKEEDQTDSFRIVLPE
jgi:uncharacterized hydrophobic protein (TIGR00271 family)